MLYHHDPNKTYYLQTDSSGFAIGAELYQLDEDDEHHVIGFISKALTGAELRWTVSEQELYAIIYSLHKFETYLRGVRIVIRTDHQALTFLKNWKMYSARVTRWLLFLNQFDFKVEYVKGKDNVGPDVLSRYSYEAENVQEEKVVCPEIAAFKVKEKQAVQTRLANIKQLQDQDEFLGEISKTKGRGHFGPNTMKVNRYIKNYKLQDNVLYYTGWKGKTLLAIPYGLAEDLIKFVHLELGHGGGFKTGAALRDRYFWPGMGRQIKQIVRVCRLCQLAKRELRPTVGPGKSLIAKDVGELVMADIYGPLPRGVAGVRFIFVIQDSFSRYIRLFNLKVATTKSVLSCVDRFNRIIKIKSLLTDNGTQFTSKHWNQRMAKMGIKVLHTSIRNPGPNITERVNKELGRIFRVYCHTKHTTWPSFVGDIERTYNNTIHCSTGLAPNEVIFGKSPNYSLDKHLKGCVLPTRTKEEIKELVRKNLTSNAIKRQRFYNVNKRLVTYELGTLVKLKKITQSNLLKKQIKKFALLYEGPYVVAAAPYSNTYTLVDPVTRQIKGDYSAIHLARYYISDSDRRVVEGVRTIVEGV